MNTILFVAAWTIRRMRIIPVLTVILPAYLIEIHKPKGLFVNNIMTISSHTFTTNRYAGNALTDESLQQSVYTDGRSLARIAWHVVISIPEFLAHFGLNADPVKNRDDVPSSAKHIANTFEQVKIQAAEVLKQQWTDESSKQVQNAFGRDLPNAAILGLLTKHMVHHRGQMTVLMRQAGLKVPGAYGPAVEEWGQWGQEPPAI